MSHGYGPKERDDDESIRVIGRAVELGIDLFDTADAYGPFSNERLLGRALAAHRDQVRIATKCGLVARPDGRFGRNGRPDYLRSACEGSLRRLGVEAIDLYQLHRVDPAVPLAESWGALSDLVSEGKVRRLGISHATREELEQVHSIFPITAVQYELSVWVTHSLDDILPWARKNGVGFLAFAPIGRGYLSGRLEHDQLEADDSRKRDPRFASDAMRTNHAIVQGLRKVAARHGATPAQVAIAWTLTRGDNVVPIPGTRHLRWLEENAAAVDLRLTEEDLHDIDNLPAATGEMIWDRTRFATSEVPEMTRG
ncbi:aryl-alcohol dehydrogenase-like predicted oxidoreductase [Saccharothrix tamanrassetensis]|uniref:Aryl-alcohol dehydrogenase-like predicted oxidoreductase n=2 Tax=Saccharothrix tamanrassetensis TaxID=1051531 RepID=A0A841CQB2_9PSEU|nr:aryl-alcohol dehydrogenase-like predicted oxidoreductase [Saccharothrix tamanrassetensis]